MKKYELRIESGIKVVLTKSDLTLVQCASWIEEWQMGLNPIDYYAFPDGFKFVVTPIN